VGEPDVLTLGDWQLHPGIQIEEPNMFSTDCSGLEGHAAVPIPGTDVETGLYSAFPRDVLETRDLRIRGRVLALGRFISELRDGFHLFHSIAGASPAAAAAGAAALQEAFAFSQPLLAAVVFNWYPAAIP
jgi:hypothetical protein